VCVCVFVLELRLYNIYTGKKAATALFFYGGAIGKKEKTSEKKIFCDFAPLLQVLSLEHFWDPNNKQQRHSWPLDRES
jgi:hypothetical protein